jgi:FkbM family methyltransferase
MIGKLASDFKGIARVSGVGTALRWAACVALTMPRNLKTRNLLAADQMMGTGPFRVRHAVGSAILTGQSAFSGLREIWVRDVYARGNFLQIPDGGLVVDLGANMGNFSAMALAANPKATLVGVEPSREIAGKWRATVKANGFEDRARLCEAFVGVFTDKQQRDFDNDPNYQGVAVLSEGEFLERYGIERIAFLKCDIEGSEFFMIEPGSRILDMTDRLAIEVHDFGGDVNAFLNGLKERGFTEVSVDWYGAECIARAARPSALAQAA